MKSYVSSFHLYKTKCLLLQHDISNSIITLTLFSLLYFPDSLYVSKNRFDSIDQFSTTSKTLTLYTIYLMNKYDIARIFW